MKKILLAILVLWCLLVPPRTLAQVPTMVIDHEHPAFLCQLAIPESSPTIKYCGKTFFNTSSSITSFTTHDKKAYTISGKTVASGSSLPVKTVYTYTKGTHVEIEQSVTDIPISQATVILNEMKDGNALREIQTAPVNTNGEFTFQFNKSLQQSANTYLYITVRIKGSYTILLGSQGNVTFDYNSISNVGSANPDNAQLIAQESSQHPLKSSDTKGVIQEFFSGLLQGSGSVFKGLFNILKSVIDILVSGVNLLLNNGDHTANLNTFIRSLTILGLTAVFLGSTFLLAGLIGGPIAGLLAAAIVMSVATTGSIAVSVQHGTPFQQAFNENVCGKQNASIAYCTGYIAGQWATGEVIGYGVGKGLGYVVDEIKANKIVIPRKISNQFGARGWTESSLKETVKQPFTVREGINKANGNKANIYYNKDGSYVSVDSITNEIIQVSARNDKKWVPDDTILNPYKP